MSAAALKRNVPKRSANHPSPTAADPDVPTCMQALERVLRAQLEGYTRLQVVIGRQREAIVRADPAALAQAAEEQQSLVETMATVDTQRTKLIAVIQRSLASEARGEATLSGLLGRANLAEDQRARLLGLAAELREAIRATKRGGSIVRDAANALARHMAGIQQTVHSALSRARVYERRGRLNLGSSMPAAVDMKS